MKCNIHDYSALNWVYKSSRLPPSTEAFARNSPLGSPHGCGELAKGQEAPFANPTQKLRSAGCKRRLGGLFFGYFLLAKQKKVSRLSVREPTLKWPRNAKLSKN
jgi:hypothetical protein